MSTSFTLQKKLQTQGSSFLGKALYFLKQSLLISFIFSTILYSLMRLFFIGADFSNAESVELFVKTFLITYFYINAWRVICLGIIWIEQKTIKVKFKGIFSMQGMKRAAVFILVVGFAYKVNANSSVAIPKCSMAKKVMVKEHEVIPEFYLWTK